MSFLEEMWELYESTKETKDPRTRNWLLISDSPLYAILIVMLYYGIAWTGPKLMRNRKAFELQTFMVVYNAFQVILSAYMCVEIIYSAYLLGYFTSKNPLCIGYNYKEAYKDPREMRLAEALHLHYLSKVLEMVDTLLMVLRKKDNQITFLHLFHHSSIFLLWWYWVSYIPGGQSWQPAWMNCVVHTVMYSYYALAAIPSMRHRLWWKKYITKLQLTYFRNWYGHCDVPVGGVISLAIYMKIMIILFGNFYYKSYQAKQQQKQKKVEKQG